jgi:hypothetical protein
MQLSEQGGRQGPDIAHWVGAIKRATPGEAMQLQPSLCAANLALFGLDCGISTKPLALAD